MEELIEFLQRLCGCKIKNGQPGFVFFSKEHYECVRDQCTSLSRNELVPGKIMANLHCEDMVGKNIRSHNWLSFHHLKFNICRSTFFMLHDIGCV